MESDEDLLRKLAKHNFIGKIRRKVNFFVPGTREWLLEKVNEWFQMCDSDSRVKLITAGPGFGKSVFAAKICKDFEKNGKLAACHFCDFSDSNLRDPMVMLQSLASQMCENVPGFKERLLDQLKRPYKVQNLKDGLRIYLQNPLDELQIKEPRLIVIDGLDESAADNKNEITHLIAEYFPYLPEYIKILVTSRPEISVADLRLRDDQKTDISNVDDNNNLDLGLYFEKCFPTLVERRVGWSGISGFLKDNSYLLDISGYGTNSLLSIFVAKCQGSFLYAYQFQSGLRARYDLENITNNEVMEFLPEGLNSIYQGYFKRLEDELNAIKHEKFDVLNILAMLAASEGPLPLTFVAQAFGLAPDCRETKDIINKINETVSCLLYVSDDMLTVFHKSVIDWLLAKGYKDHQYTVKVDDGHRSLWLLCEKVFKEIKDKGVRSGLEVNFTDDVKYALNHGLKHGLKHLEKCKMEEGVFWSVDAIIVAYMLAINDPNDLVNFWRTLLQCSWIKNEDLRARISYHVIEFDDLNDNIDYHSIKKTIFSQWYLQAVLTHSPEGYFSDDEKKVAETLLSNLSRFVESNSYDVSVLPRPFWKCDGYDFITAVALSNDEKTVAVAAENDIYVFSLPTLVEIMSYSTKWEIISCLTFSPDDSLILFGELETAFNIAGRKEVPFFPGNEEVFLYCAFSPNGKRLVTSHGLDTIKLWDVAKQTLLSSLCAGFPVVSGVGFSEGFVSLGLERNEPVKVLDVRDVDGLVMINLPGIEPEMEVEIPPGGAFISGCNKNKCYIWKRNTEKPNSYEVFYHRDAGRSTRFSYVVIFSNDSKVAIVMHLSSNESQIIDLDTGDSQNITPAFQPIPHLSRSFCIHKSRIVLTLSDYLIAFHDMDSGAILSTSYQRYMETLSPSQTIQLSPKEDVLAFPDNKVTVMLVVIILIYDGGDGGGFYDGADGNCAGYENDGRNGPFA
ncbi:uncharacterized protein LOC114540593 [Dendronephthya gigantea]|uniref:uncharacterized protein LOC114540593 n=1 Tax=Dendronephthya gigantea TaxID=151771 RepID=UPI00106BB4AA|nr:uncharacterized protein LOC114540593 [Dendronephthya gigantea]